MTPVRFHHYALGFVVGLNVYLGLGLAISLWSLNLAMAPMFFTAYLLAMIERNGPYGSSGY